MRVRLLGSWTFVKLGEGTGATEYGGLRAGSAGRGPTAKTRYGCDVT